MQVTCPNCRARYAVDRLSIGRTGRTVQCGRCSHRWFKAMDGAAFQAPPPAPSPHNEPAKTGTARRRVHWGRWVTIASAAVLAIGTAGFVYHDELRTSPRSDRNGLVNLDAARGLFASLAKTPEETIIRPRLQLDPARTMFESVDGRYMVRGELYNPGRIAASSTVLRLVFLQGDEMLAERLYPLIEGPIAPGERLAFVRKLDDPPEGTTDVVPAVE